MDVNKIKNRLEKYSIPEPNTGCWLWTGSARSGGYGQLYVGNRKYKMSHRLSYEIFNGPIQENMDILHVCDTPSCINPFHLKQGTHKENMQDCFSKKRNPQWRRTHCKMGHEFTPDNTYYDENKKGKYRACRECRIQRSTLKRRSMGMRPNGEWKRKLNLCKRGHNYKKYAYITKRGYRQCKLCCKISARARRLAKNKS